jgi:hypothetical protein
VHSSSGSRRGPGKMRARRKGLDGMWGVVNLSRHRSVTRLWKAAVVCCARTRALLKLASKRSQPEPLPSSPRSSVIVRDCARREYGATSSSLDENGTPINRYEGGHNKACPWMQRHAQSAHPKRDLKTQCRPHPTCTGSLLTRTKTNEPSDSGRTQTSPAHLSSGTGVTDDT